MSRIRVGIRASSNAGCVTSCGRPPATRCSAIGMTADDSDEPDRDHRPQQPHLSGRGGGRFGFRRLMRNYSGSSLYTGRKRRYFSMKHGGAHVWYFPDGYLPEKVEDSRLEPHEALMVLNTGSAPASIELDFYFEDREPVKGVALTVGAERSVCFRLDHPEQIGELGDPAADAVWDAAPVGCAGSGPVRSAGCDPAQPGLLRQYRLRRGVAIRLLSAVRPRHRLHPDAHHGAARAPPSACCRHKSPRAAPAGSFPAAYPAFPRLAMAIRAARGRDGGPERQRQVVDENVDLRNEQLAVALGHVQDVHTRLSHHARWASDTNRPVLADRMLHCLVGQAGGQGANPIGRMRG